MTNRDIDRFFADHILPERVQKQVRPPNEMWLLRVGRFPVLIQTQENADRMRIVAFIAEEPDLEPDELTRLLQANYHSALDARYALTDDGALVSVFLHPFAELGPEQFVLGFCQVLNCAETCGSHYSGGTMTFGRPPQGRRNGESGPALVTSRAELAERINDG